MRRVREDGPKLLPSFRHNKQLGIRGREDELVLAGSDYFSDGLEERSVARLQRWEAVPIADRSRPPCHACHRRADAHVPSGCMKTSRPGQRTPPDTGCDDKSAHGLRARIIVGCTRGLCAIMLINRDWRVSSLRSSVSLESDVAQATTCIRRTSEEQGVMPALERVSVAAAYRALSHASVGSTAA